MVYNVSLSPIIAYHYHKYLFRTLFSERYVDRKHVQTRLVLCKMFAQASENSDAPFWTSCFKCLKVLSNSKSSSCSGIVVLVICGKHP